MKLDKNFKSTNFESYNFTDNINFKKSSFFVVTNSHQINHYKIFNIN